ncbi:hypothetical protein FBQ97_18840, partial [Acidobacteria bacterium ACD]|nr:hypothetical protein [Acidobacteria bacterium ACD]
MNPLVETVTTRANRGIDPVLHAWGWEIVVYLFLGGVVAGILVWTAALELRSGSRPRSRALLPMPFVALGLLSVGMLALWLDLANRLWAWRFYAFFRATSPMSWGAWILVLIYPAGLLFGLGSLDPAQREWLRAKTPRLLSGLLGTLQGWADGARRGVLATNVVLGVGLGIYTGLLLGTMPARIQWNTAVLGPLFLASGLSTGAAGRPAETTRPDPFLAETACVPHLTAPAVRARPRPCLSVRARLDRGGADALLGRQAARGSCRRCH